MKYRTTDSRRADEVLSRALEKLALVEAELASAEMLRDDDAEAAALLGSARDLVATASRLGWAAKRRAEAA